MNIQPDSGPLQLRSGNGKYLDQLEVAQSVLSLWQADYGKQGLDTAARLHSPRNAACLTFDVGTGKTATSLRILYGIKAFLKDKNDARWQLPSLIVCRDKAKMQWVQEAEKWVPEWDTGKFILFEGDKQQVGMWLDIWTMVQPYAIVMNYDKLTDYNEELVKRGPYLCVILDEIHAIAYADTQRNQSADALDTYYRIGLTGTAIRREPDSVHGILNWLQPGKYKTRLTPATAPKPCKGCHWEDQKGWWNYYKAQGCSAKSMGGKRCDFFIGDDKDASHGFCAWAAQDIYGEPAGEHKYHLYSPEWGAFKPFQERYCRLVCASCGAEFMGSYWQGGQDNCGHRYRKVAGAKNAQELHDRLYSDTKLFWPLDARNIPGFPEVYPRRVDCTLTTKQSKLYREAENGLIQWLDDKGEWGSKNVTNILAQLAMLRSIATLPPGIVIEKLKGAKQYPEWLEGVKIPADMDGGKQNWVESFFEDYFEVGDKLVLFSEWTFVTHDYFRRISDILRKRGERAIHIHGGMKDFEWQKQAFNTDPLVSVAVCSPAGSESLNLHEGLIGKEGRMWVIHSDVSWTPGEIKQRTGRIQRCGGKNAIANFLTATLDDGGETIDSRMIARVLSRASASDMITGSKLSELFDFGSKGDVMSLLGR